MATSGKDNLERNWRGQNHQSTVKKAVNYYSKTSDGAYSTVGSLSPGTLVTYLDSLTQDHLKAAFRLSTSEDVYYANIDYFVKPKSRQATATSLGPSSFGLENQSFTSSTSYYNQIINSINSRNDIDGELFDYLYELLDYVYNGAGNYNGIQLTAFPWGQLQNYYAEVIGPIACIKRGILSGLINTTGISGAQIYMPPDSERLYDYKIIIGGDEHMISAKSAKGVSNQVKPQFVTSITEKSGKLGNLQMTKEFNLLKILGENTVVAGALKGWSYIAPTEMTPAAAQSIISVYRGDGHNLKVPDPQALKPFIDKHITAKRSNPGSVTVGEVRYKCEQLIQNWSKVGSQNIVLKNIFDIYLNESRVIYVKMDLNKTTGVPAFSASAGGGSTLVRNLYLRSSNYATRTADRIGFQVG